MIIMRIFYKVNKNIFSYAVKKLSLQISSDQKKQFLESREFREAKILYDLKSEENFCKHVIKYEDCFFDEENYFYLVLEFCQVISTDFSFSYLLFILNVILLFLIEWRLKKAN